MCNCFTVSFEMNIVHSPLLVDDNYMGFMLTNILGNITIREREIHIKIRGVLKMVVSPKPSVLPLITTNFG